MTQLESSIIPTRDRAAQDVVNSARPRTYSVARRVVVAPAAVEYKPAVSSRDRGHSSATASHSDAHARRRRCVLPAARIPQQEVGSSERRLDLIYFFPHSSHIFYPPNTAIMLWTASQVLRKFSTSSVSTAALLLSLHHRMNSSFDTVTEKCCWYTLSARQVLVTSGGLSQARFWSRISELQFMCRSLLVSLLLHFYSKRSEMMVCQRQSATLLYARLCPPPLSPLWLYALTELAFTVQDLEELHQPLSSNLSSNIGLDLSRAAGKPRAQLRMSSLLIHSSFFFVCVQKQMTCMPSLPGVLGAIPYCGYLLGMNGFECITVHVAVCSAAVRWGGPWTLQHISFEERETWNLPPSTRVLLQSKTPSLPRWMRGCAVSQLLFLEPALTIQAIR